MAAFEEEKEYKLRVRAKGEGMITVQHGKENLETMTFANNQFATQEQRFFLENPTVEVLIQSEDHVFQVDSVEIFEVLEVEKE